MGKKCEGVGAADSQASKKKAVCHAQCLISLWNSLPLDVELPGWIAF